MKKFIIVGFLLITTMAMAVFSGGWNFVLHRDMGCIPVASGYTAGDLLNDGCTVTKFHRNNTIMVLDCVDHPTVKGYVWYGRTKVACEWAKQNADF